MTDAEIIGLYLSRNEDAIRGSREKYGAYCFSIAKNILGDARDSEECVNSVWLKAWDSIPPAKPQVLKLYLAKLTRSLAFNRLESRQALKRGGGEADLVLDELESCAGSGDAATEAELKELREAVARFVKTLPERERNVLIRRCFYTEPVEKIAERYGVSGSGVLSALSRARKKLRNYLVKEGFIDERKRSL